MNTAVLVENKEQAKTVMLYVGMTLPDEQLDVNYTQAWCVGLNGMRWGKVDPDPTKETYNIISFERFIKEFRGRSVINRAHIDAVRAAYKLTPKADPPTETHQ